MQKERQKQNPPGGGEEFDFFVKARIQGEEVRIGVRRGDRLKDILARAKFQMTGGLILKLNNRSLRINAESLELEDNPILEEGDFLVIENTFSGGFFSSF